MRAGWKQGGLVAFGMTLAGPALAQDIPAGEVVQIKSLAKDDAFWESRKGIVGLTCAVEAEGLHVQVAKQKWYGGSMTCVDGQNYYFYKVEVQRGEFGLTYEAIVGHPLGQAPAEAASAWPVGTNVQITGVSPADAHINDAPMLVGQVCVVKDAGLEVTGEGWFSGQLACRNGMDRYFYQVAVVAAGSAPAPAPVSAPVTTGASAGAWPAGKMVKVLDLSPIDALHGQKSAIVGRTCSVVEAPLVDSGEGYYAGRLFCDDGKGWQVFKAKVASP